MPTPSRDIDPIPKSRVSPSSRSTSKSESFPHGSSPHRSNHRTHTPVQASSTYHHQHNHMPPHTSRSNSAPQSPSYLAHRPHTSTGYVSDGGTSVASVVDMKRLLSKPALPSSPSLPSHSDSEALSSSGSRAHIRTTGKKPDLEASASSSRHTLDESRSSGRPIKKEDKPMLLVDTSASPSTLQQSTSPLEDPPSTYPRPGSVSSSTRDSKPHTTLKRRPSGPRSAPLTPFSTSEAKPRLAVDSLQTKRAGLPEMEGATSSPLTPAGAVAEAYKQQAQKRRSSGGDNTPKVSPPPFSDALAAETSEDAISTSPMPYYTVFGSISGRLVAVGGPDDILLDGYNIHGRRQSPRPETGTGRNLTRKVSARWKKATGGGIKAERSPSDTSPSSSSTDVDGQAIAQERRSLSLPGRDRSKQGWSYGVHSPDMASTSGSISAMQNASTAKAWVPSAVEEDVRAKPSKLVKARSGDRERDSPKEKDNEEEGGIIWKLMKRISTGGLRDRYSQAADKVPPPVPALPKDFAHQNVRQSVDDDSSGVLSRIMNSRASMPATGSGSHSPRTSSSHPIKVGPSSTGPRPSTTTGSSSSPVSSDFASSQFFHPTHSAGSSSSSYGEEVPHPISSPMIAQHIIPPRELYRMNMDHENEISYPKSSPNFRLRTHRSTSVPVCDSLPPPDNSPEEIHGTLPFPPRRLAASGNTSQRHSKISPSKADTISAFRRQTSPSPRASGQHDSDINLSSSTRLVPQSDSDNIVGTPSRLSSKRPRRPRLGSMSLSQSSISPPIISLPDETEDHSCLAEDPHRKSSGGFSNASTVRQRSSPFNTSITSHPPTQSQSRCPITGDSAIRTNTRSPPSSARSPLTFRELGNSHSARAPLTAQEKADIWDDLLERSDRAGGTIHLGGQVLMSDQMRLAGGSRLSNYTETTDIP